MKLLDRITNRHKIRQLEAMIQGIIVGVNPFDEYDIAERKDLSEKLSYFYGIEIGEELLLNAEHHIEKMVKENISTDAYLKSSTYIDTTP